MNVGRSRHFCNPADKNEEGIGDPTAHLNCYKLKGRMMKVPDVIVGNQFGEQRFTVRRPVELCVPATKDGIASELRINHFQCYTVKPAPGTPPFLKQEVTVSDQFEEGTRTRVIRPLVLCTPVDKNGEGIVDPENHLMCYRIRDAGKQQRFIPEKIEVADQFVEDSGLAVRASCHAPALICVPSAVKGTCGDGTVGPSENCDPPGSFCRGGCNPFTAICVDMACREDCTCPEPSCGDLIIDSPDEECDDGNNIDGDGCSAGCFLEGEICGGIAGRRCPSGEFCEFVPQACLIPDILGVCQEIPDPCICPDVFDPVCGCDGRTYGNACEARCAAVSVAHGGPCVNE